MVLALWLPMSKEKSPNPPAVLSLGAAVPGPAPVPPDGEQPASSAVTTAAAKAGRNRRPEGTQWEQPRDSSR